jgi:ribosomal protein S18 acetylase RimI-like enzyme
MTRQRRRPAAVRLQRLASPSLHSWAPPPYLPAGVKENASVDAGWGRIFFGQTFSRHEDLIRLFGEEPAGRRDLAIYVWEHHILVGKAPELLFVDPSIQYRLWIFNYRHPKRRTGGFMIRPLLTRADAEAQNAIYDASGMVTADPDVVLENQATQTFSYFLAVDGNDRVIGTITGVDHVKAFGDPDNGASFWCLAVRPGRRTRGVGKTLVRQLAEHYLARGREYLDLSVMHDNRRAIRLYRTLGFRQVPVYVVKRRNDINRPLYSGGPPPDGHAKP